MQKLFDSGCRTEPAKPKDEPLEHENDPAYEFDAATETYRPRVLRFLYGSTPIATAHLIQRGAVGTLNGCLFDKNGMFVAFAPGAVGAECPYCAGQMQALSAVLVLRCSQGHCFSVPQGTPIGRTFGPPRSHRRLPGADCKKCARRVALGALSGQLASAF